MASSLLIYYPLDITAVGSVYIHIMNLMRDHHRKHLCSAHIALEQLRIVFMTSPVIRRYDLRRNIEI